MAEQIKSCNKSNTYLIPLLATQMRMDFIYLIANTYIKFNPPLEDIDYPIGILYDLDASEEFSIYREYLQQQNMYYNHYYVNDQVLFVFHMPEQFRSDYILFKEGKYSKMSYDAKKAILEYASKTYKYAPLIEDITGVLWKHKNRREKLEKQLNVSIPQDVELASIIVYEDETFNFD